MIITYRNREIKELYLYFYSTLNYTSENDIYDYTTNVLQILRLRIRSDFDIAMYSKLVDLQKIVTPAGSVVKIFLELCQIFYPTTIFFCIDLEGQMQFFD